MYSVVHIVCVFSSLLIFPQQLALIDGLFQFHNFTPIIAIKLSLLATFLFLPPMDLVI